MQSLSEDDLSNEAFGFFNARRAYLREVPVTALRLSYVGELGWEIYTSADLGLRLWDLLWEAGRPYGVFSGGRGAFNSLRVEKGYRAWGTDMTTEHDPYEAGLGFAVKEDKGDFVGREALLERKEAGVRRKLVCLVLDDPDVVVMGSEPVWAEDGGRLRDQRRLRVLARTEHRLRLGAARARLGGDHSGDRVLRCAPSGDGHRGAALRSGDEEDEGMMEDCGPNSERRNVR